MSCRVLGVAVSAQEVASSLDAIAPAAKKFLERPLGTRCWMYLYLDGTYFAVHRTTVDKEPMLVVLGVDELGHKSVLAVVQGDRDNVAAWRAVFAGLKERGLDPLAVRFGVMDGLPGLEGAFREAFPAARVGRCWVHRAANVFPLVPRRYQAAFKASWDAVQYAESGAAVRMAFEALKGQWAGSCAEAVGRWSARWRHCWPTTSCRASTGTRRARRTRSSASTRSSSGGSSRWSTRVPTRSA